MIVLDVSSRAIADLESHAAYIAVDSEVAARRLYHNAWTTLAYLAENPRVGAFFSRRGKLKTVRSWSVTGFWRHRIIYREITGGVEILRILHSSQDVARILRREPM